MNKHIRNMVFQKLAESFSFDDADDEIVKNRKVNTNKSTAAHTQSYIDGLIHDADDNIKITAESYKQIMVMYDNGLLYTVSNKDELKDIVENIVTNVDARASLNWINVSKINDMSKLFRDSEFNGDISKWDVSNVEDMSYMFAASQFNGDISKWDVSSVETMAGMFWKSVFNGNISNWKPISLHNMDYMFFKDSYFDQDISNWPSRTIQSMRGTYVGSGIKSSHQLRIDNE